MKYFTEEYLERAVVPCRHYGHSTYRKRGIEPLTIMLIIAFLVAAAAVTAYFYTSMVQRQAQFTLLRMAYVRTIALSTSTLSLTIENKSPSLYITKVSYKIYGPGLTTPLTGDKDINIKPGSSAALVIDLGTTLQMYANYHIIVWVQFDDGSSQIVWDGNILARP